MNGLFVTVDIDWASEPAIEQTLDFLLNSNITPTVFVTHRSPAVLDRMERLDVGLHPYFDPHSSHGSTIDAVVEHVLSLPFNVPMFRFHRFAGCNGSRQAMAAAGMRISSNVCTDLEIIPPFRDRCGLLEVPIFLEDGGYLWRKHPLFVTPPLKEKMSGPGMKVIIIHPMHFVVNTPDFAYMRQIKHSLGREEWNHLDASQIAALQWKGRGIRDFLMDLIECAPAVGRLNPLP